LANFLTSQTRHLSEASRLFPLFWSSLHGWRHQRGTLFLLLGPRQIGGSGWSR
jgi:hypothetical protein